MWSNNEKEHDTLLSHSKTYIADQVIGIALRRYKMLLIGLSVGFLLGFAYLSTAMPKYTAATQLLINAKTNLPLGLNEASPLSDLGLDTSVVENQIEILKSKNVAYKVIDDLNLGAEEPGEGFFARLSRIFKGSNKSLSDAQNKTRDREDVVRSLERNLSISRIGHSYVLQVAFTSSSADRAVAIANAFAKAYINSEIEAIYEDNRRSNEWLLSSVEELKKKSIESDYAVQRFKAEKGLISTTQNGSSVLVSDQQLAQINNQLITAKAATIDARIKYELINEIIAKGEVDAAVSESLANPVILQLRNKYLTASKNRADLAARIGPNHEQVLKLGDEMNELKRLIFDELRRIAASYKSEMDVATDRERSLEQTLADQVGVSGNAGEQLVKLRELVREADTYKNLYQNMLHLYQESLHSQLLPVSDTRIITLAEPPAGPSSPKRIQTLVISLLIGSMLGAGLALYSEMRDRGLWTAAQVKDHLGLKFLGMLPAVTPQQLKKIAGLPHVDGTSSPLMQYSFKAPFSRFTEALCTTKVAIDAAHGEKKPKVIGVVSALSGEGKSVVSKNLASMIASTGKATLLIDGDFRNPTMTRELAPDSDANILDVLSERKSLNDVLMSETETHLAFLPGSLSEGETHTKELFGSAEIERLIAASGDRFEYIVVDLPPLGPVVDARIAAGYFDAFVLVVAWGTTPRDVLYSVLKQEKEVCSKCVGVLLNKVDKRRFAFHSNRAWKSNYEPMYYRDEPEISPELEPVS